MNVSKLTAKRFIDGDEGATVEVYQAYKRLLYFIIATYVDKMEDCDDVYQNVFLKILSKRGEISSPSSLHYYLCQTAKNEAIDYAKKSRHEETSDEMEEAIGESESALDYLLPYDLTQEEKAIVGYRVNFGFSHKEIAEMLGTSVPTVKRRYAEALRKIKGAYGK